MNPITKTKKIIEDVLGEYKTELAKISARKRDLVKDLTDRISKEKVEEIVKDIRK